MESEQSPRNTSPDNSTPSSPQCEEPTQQFTMEEVAQHDQPTDLWVVISGKVYDLTNFKKHPGGPRILWRHAGKDATENFNRAGHRVKTREMMRMYCIGFVENGSDDPPPKLSAERWILPVMPQDPVFVPAKSLLPSASTPSDGFS